MGGGASAILSSPYDPPIGIGPVGWVDVTVPLKGLVSPRAPVSANGLVVAALLLGWPNGELGFPDGKVSFSVFRLDPLKGLAVGFGGFSGLGEKEFVGRECSGELAGDPVGAKGFTTFEGVVGELDSKVEDPKAE